MLSRVPASGLFLSWLAFQVGWLSCILGAAQGRPWLGPAVVAGLLWLHLSRRPQPGLQLLLILGAGALGYLADSLLVLAGLIQFEAHADLGGPSPLWMVALWMNLAATLQASLPWLAGRYRWLGLVGAIGGPASYLAGQRLGALVFGPSPVWTGIWIGVEWVLAGPALLWWVSRAAPQRVKASGQAVEALRREL